MALLKSPPCDVGFITLQTDAEEMTQTYNLTITNILDRLAPPSQVTRRKRRSDIWYDEDCRQLQPLMRRLERRYRRSNRKEDLVTWLASLKNYTNSLAPKRQCSGQPKLPDRGMTHASSGRRSTLSLERLAHLRRQTSAPTTSCCSLERRSLMYEKTQREPLLLASHHHRHQASFSRR